MGLGQHAVLPLPARGARVIRGYRYPLASVPARCAYFFPAFGFALARLIWRTDGRDARGLTGALAR